MRLKQDEVPPDNKLQTSDDKGEGFACGSATAYCAEDEYTRLARDIFLLAGNKVLLRKWGGGGHRAQILFGNGFGTFFYRPPKNVPATEGDIKWAVPMWEVDAGGWLLTFKIDGLGPKNSELGAIFGPEAKDAMLEAALDAEAKCYVMPSSSQSDKSSIAAPMAVLVNFIQCDQVDLGKFPDLTWADIEQAVDPKFNVHAGVLASYCRDKAMVSAERLAAVGWADGELPIRVALPNRLSTLRGWGADMAWVYTAMKGLLLGQDCIQKPLPRRVCDPRSEA